MSLDIPLSGPEFRPQVRKTTTDQISKTEIVDYRDKGFVSALESSNSQLKEYAKIAYFNSADEILIHFSKDLMILRKIPHNATDEQKIAEIGNALDIIISRMNEMNPIKQKSTIHALEDSIMPLRFALWSYLMRKQFQNKILPIS